MGFIPAVTRRKGRAFTNLGFAGFVINLDGGTRPMRGSAVIAWKFVNIVAETRHKEYFDGKSIRKEPEYAGSTFYLPYGNGV